MTDVELKEMQMHMLHMLKEVDALFKANNIFYVLVGGSVLGAVRHNGFIPWDDDVDICILRKDCEKAEQLLSNMTDYLYEPIEKHIIPDGPAGHLHLVNKKYKLENSPTLDFFTLDKVPAETDVKRTRKFMFNANVHHLCVYRRPPKNRGIKNKIILGTFLFFTPNFILNILQKNTLKKMLNADVGDSDWLGNVFQGQKEFFPSEIYTDIIIHKFEDAEFPIPRQYDIYLKKLYGNYMELPPVEDRRPKHK